MHAKLPALLAAALALPAVASAQQSFYAADLDPLNGSGVGGRADLVLDQAANTLTVTINAAGLTPGRVHPQHIHGRFDGGLDGTPTDSVTPTLAQDADGDGFIELAEGLSQYGPVILPLGSPPPSNDDPSTQSFPTATAAGVLSFTQVYDLGDEGQFFFPMMPPSAGGPDYDANDLFPLEFREIVLHGMDVAVGAGAGTGGEVDGSGGYTMTLPVSAGEIVAVPEPASLGLLAAGGLLALRRRR